MQGVAANSGGAALRDRLSKVYVESCDRHRVNPSLHVLAWLSCGALEEPCFIDTPSLTKDMTSCGLADVSDGYLQQGPASDPIDPLIDILQLIPMNHLTFDGTGLDALQLEKILQMLLPWDPASDHTGTSIENEGATNLANASSPRRSQWTLSSLNLFGNQVDAVVFGHLLKVVEMYPLLTIVRMDPNAQCHMYELEQRCAANDARRRQPFAIRKRSEVAGTSALNDVGAAVAKPPHSQIQRHSDATAISNSSTAENHAYDVPISSFFGAIRAWIFFFYGPDKKLPDAMFYFLIASLYHGAKSTTRSYIELMEVLKGTERRFLQWREGHTTTDAAVKLAQLVIHAGEERIDPDPSRCVCCDAIVTEASDGSSPTSNSGSQHLSAPNTDANANTGVSFSLANNGSSVAKGSRRGTADGTRAVDVGRIIIEALAMESETGGKCFVENTSPYLVRVLKGVLKRCVAGRFSPSSIDRERADTNVSKGDTRFNFFKPPPLCFTRLAHCSKHFARSVLSGAAGLEHGVANLQTVSPTAPRVNEGQRFPQDSSLWKCRGSIQDFPTSNGDTLPSMLPFQVFQSELTGPSSQNANSKSQHPVDLVSVYEREVDKQPPQEHGTILIVPSSTMSKLGLQCLEPLIHDDDVDDAFAAASVVDAITTTINRHVPGYAVAVGDLLKESQTWVGCSWSRFPTQGASLEAAVRGITNGIPMRSRALSQTAGEVVHMRPTCVVHFLPRNNSIEEEQQTRPFHRILSYFLLHHHRLHGSDVIVGVKLRPSVVELLLSTQRKPQNAANTQFTVVSEPVGAGTMKHGIAVAVTVTGVTRVGGVWYAVARYGRKERPLLIDENCINRGALKYGAFAFLDCGLRDWVAAIRTVNPSVLSSSNGAALPFPLEAVELATHMEAGLILMLHIPTFYPSAEAFASRSATKLESVAHQGVLEEVHRIVSVYAPPASSNFTAEDLLWLIRRYRASDMGSLANYWCSTTATDEPADPNHPPNWFLKASIAVARMLFGKNPFASLHLSLFPICAIDCRRGESSTSSSTEKEPRAEAPLVMVDLVPPTASQEGSLDAARWQTSGGWVNLSEIVGDQRAQQSPLSWLPANYGVDLHVYKSSSNVSAASRFDMSVTERRFLDLDLTPTPWRVSRIDLDLIEVHPVDRQQAPASRQQGYLVRVAWSDDGSHYTYCLPISSVKSPSVTNRAEHKENPVMHVSYLVGNAGSHRHWAIFVDAVNDDGVVLSPTSHCQTVFPTVADVRLQYISSVTSPRYRLDCSADCCGVVEYSDNIWAVMPRGDVTDAIVVEAPTFTVGITSSLPSASKATPELASKGPIDLATMQWSYLSAGLTALGGRADASWDATIAVGAKLFVFRLPFVIEVDRHSGQLDTCCPWLVEEHPLWSLIPLTIRPHILGGFELRLEDDTTGQPREVRILVYHQTHFCVLSVTHLEVLIPATSWALLPGRLLTELDGDGVASRTLASTGLGRPPTVPFTEVTVVLPLRLSKPSPTKERLLVNFENQYVAWDFELPSSVQTRGNVINRSSSQPFESLDGGSLLQGRADAVGDMKWELPLKSLAPSLLRYPRISGWMDEAIDRAIPQVIRRTLALIRPACIDLVGAKGRTTGCVTNLWSSGQDGAEREAVSVRVEAGGSTLRLKFRHPCVPTVVQVVMECNGCSLGLFRCPPNVNDSGNDGCEPRDQLPFVVAGHDHCGVVTLLTMAAAQEGSETWEVRPWPRDGTPTAPAAYHALRTFSSALVVSRSVTGLPPTELRLSLDTTTPVRCHRLQLVSQSPMELKLHNRDAFHFEPVLLGASLSWIRLSSLTCCEAPDTDDDDAHSRIAVALLCKMQSGELRALSRRVLSKSHWLASPSVELACYLTGPHVVRTCDRLLMSCEVLGSHRLGGGLVFEADITLHIAPLQRISLLKPEPVPPPHHSTIGPNENNRDTFRPLHVRTSAKDFALSTIVRDVQHQALQVAGMLVSVSSKVTAELAAVLPPSSKPPASDTAYLCLQVEESAGAAGISVWREGPQRDWVIAVQPLHIRRRLCRITATVTGAFDGVRGSIQPVSLSYQALDGTWTHFMDTFVDALGHVDAYWHPCTILADPAPVLWRLAFVHDTNGQIQLGSLVLHCQDSARITSTQGYQVQTSSLPTHSMDGWIAASMMIPQGKVLKFTGDAATATPVITIDVPPSMPLVSGIRLQFSSPIWCTNAMNRVAIHAMLSRDQRTRVVLWQQPESHVLEGGALLATWPPCRISELHLLQASGDVQSIEFLSGSAFDSLPMRLQSQRFSAFARDTRITITSGMTTVDIATLPASLPIQVGSRIVVSTHETSKNAIRPLLFAQLSMHASHGGVLFDVACLDEESGMYISVAQLRTTSHQTVTASWDVSSIKLPKLWRLICLELADSRVKDSARDDQEVERRITSAAVSTSQGFYVDLDFAFEWMNVCPNVTGVDVGTACAAFTTNGLVRRMPVIPDSVSGAMHMTSSAMQKQRTLMKMHATQPNDNPLLHVSSSSMLPLATKPADSETISGTWEKRSQTSGTSTAFAGQSSSPFVFLVCDLHSDTRAFMGLSILADVDAGDDPEDEAQCAEFDVAVEFSDDGARYQTVAIHRQRDGWAATMWASCGRHRFWRLTLAYSCAFGASQNVGRKGRRSQSLSFGADIDEKLLSSFSVEVAESAIRNIVWLEPAQPNESGGAPLLIPTDDVAAIRAGQLADMSLVSRRSPMFLAASPIGLRPQMHQTLTIDLVDPVSAVGIFAMWRSALGRPAQTLQRTAVAAEDQLQLSLPNLTNPQQVLEKATAAEITAVFFEGKAFELNDASVSGGSCRTTNNPQLTIRGSTLTGARGIPPGTKIAMTMEWANNSLVPTHPLSDVRTVMTMSRTWLSLQSEWTSFDLMCRAAPALRNELFVDLDTVVAVYAIAQQPLRFGGNFDPLPLPQLTPDPPTSINSPQASLAAGVELDIRTGVTVVSKTVSVSVLRRICESTEGLVSLLPVLDLFFGSTAAAVVTLHTPFDASIVRMEITPCGMPLSPNDVDLATITDPCKTLVKWHSIKIVVVFHPKQTPSTLSPNVSLQDHIGATVVAPIFDASLIGSVTLPSLFGSAPFFAHATIDPIDDFNPDAATSCRQPWLLSVRAVDDTSAQEYLLGPDARIELKQLSGVMGYSFALVRGAVGTCFSLIREYVLFNGLLRFSNSWHIPCQLRLVQGSCSFCHPVLQLVTNASCQFTQKQLLSYIHRVQQLQNSRSVRREKHATISAHSLLRAFGSQPTTPDSCAASQLSVNNSCLRMPNTVQTAAPLNDAGPAIALRRYENFVGQFRCTIDISPPSAAGRRDPETNVVLLFHGHASFEDMHLLPVSVQFPLSSSNPRTVEGGALTPLDHFGSNDDLIRLMLYIRGGSDQGMQHWSWRGLPIHSVVPAVGDGGDHHVALAAGQIRLQVSRNGTGIEESEFLDVRTPLHGKIPMTYSALRTVGKSTHQSLSTLMAQASSVVSMQLQLRLEEVLRLRVTLPALGHTRWSDFESLVTSLQAQLISMHPQLMMSITSVTPSWGSQVMWRVTGAVAGVPFDVAVNLLGDIEGGNRIVGEGGLIARRIAHAVIQTCAAKVVAVGLHW